MLSRLSLVLCCFVVTSLMSCVVDDSEATTAEWSAPDIDAGPAAADEPVGTENADVPCVLIDVFRDICASGGDCTQYMCCSFGGPFCPTGA